MLQGRRALVLGAANKHSIAWAVARAWRAHGAEVILTAQDERLQRRVEALVGEEKEWHDPVVLQVDVDDDASLERCAEQVAQRFGGKLDMALHGVAFAPRECLHGPAGGLREGAVGGVFTHSPRADFVKALETSVFSLVAVARELGPLLAAGASERAGTSSLTTLTFDGSARVVPGYNVMGPAKGALESSARYLAAELGAHGVRVNAISAGPMNTLAARGLPGFSRLRQEAAARAPLPPATAADVGDTAVYLASDLAAAVTGQTLFVDAGESVIR